MSKDRKQSTEASVREIRRDGESGAEREGRLLTNWQNIGTNSHFERFP